MGHEVTKHDLDGFMLAVDSYATASAHKQRHIANRFTSVVERYAKMTGMTKKAAHERLIKLIK